MGIDKPLTPIDVLAVVLNGNYDAAEACAIGLSNYASTLPCPVNHVPAIVHHEGEWRFDTVTPWNDDGSVM